MGQSAVNWGFCSWGYTADSRKPDLYERIILESDAHLRTVCDHTRQRYIGNRWVCADCGAGI